MRLPSAPSGSYAIWVGTSSQGNCGATMSMETWGRATTSARLRRRPGLPQLSPEVALVAAGQVTAGGNIDLGLCGSIPGHGFIIQSPDFTIGYNNLNMGRDLEIRVNGSCDTVLLVNDANGQWHFSDDENGTFNPSMRLPNAPSGSYDIWVGTFSQGNCGATMSMETFGGGAVPPPPPPPPPPVMGNFPPPFARTVFPDPGNLTAWRGRTGQIVSFAVTPANNGTVWGTDIYTDDSSLAMAAVHAGLLLPGQTGIVTVVIRPGQNSYPGTARNGVQTQNFANWGGSFSFVFP